MMSMQARRRRTLGVQSTSSELTVAAQNVI
jgi:hypothetical protein